MESILEKLLKYPGYKAEINIRDKHFKITLNLNKKWNEKFLAEQTNGIDYFYFTDYDNYKVSVKSPAGAIRVL